jgi:hypothetical protein
MNKKKWYLSKTMWVNILAATVDIASGFATGGALTALSVANMVLRAITKQPIGK